jgi:hypothetical protein
MMRDSCDECRIDVWKAPGAGWSPYAKLFFWIMKLYSPDEPRRDVFVVGEAEVRGIAITPSRHQFPKLVDRR